MTNKEFALNYAGKEFMYYGIRVALVGYDSECTCEVIVSPVEIRTEGCFWECLDSGDVITYRAERKVYQYAQIDELEPVPDEKPRTAPDGKPRTAPGEKPRTPGECIAYFEGQQGMNYSIVNGSVSAVYKRQGGALKLVSWGEGISNVTERV